MLRFIPRVFLVFALSVAASVAAENFALEPEIVHFPSRDGTSLNALFFQARQKIQAQEASAEAAPTVIALHGCGGLYARAGERRGKLNPRHQAMAELLVGEGYHVVFPDSLTPRGENELCTQKIGQRRIDQKQRRSDALATLAWVARQRWADSERIAVLGWSHGGSAVLSSINGRHAQVRSEPVKAALAIAFYPGCSDSLRRFKVNEYAVNTRLMMMLGALDDWTSPVPCIELGKAVGAEMAVFAGSYHAFDNPTGKPHLRREVPNGVKPGQGVHAGGNPEAREQAYARLRNALHETFAHKKKTDEGTVRE